MEGEILRNKACYHRFMIESVRKAQHLLTIHRSTCDVHLSLVIPDTRRPQPRTALEIPQVETLFAPIQGVADGGP